MLVTGANGYIASNIVDLLLEEGYNVRGTVRTEKAWLNKYFDDKYGKGRFETKIVAALNDDGAFDEVVKGVTGIIHSVRYEFLQPSHWRVLISSPDRWRIYRSAMTQMP